MPTGNREDDQTGTRESAAPDAADPAIVESFLAHYPKLYHVAEFGSWPSIKRHGLLSTSALLDLFEVSGPERSSIESEWRAEAIQIEHHEHGVAVVRDQRPMPPGQLEPLLDGMTPREWYELLNGKTFFWLTEERLGWFLNAKLYRGRVHDVITVDTGRLLRRHWDRITVATINTGSTLGRKWRRGSSTFQSIKDYPLDGRKPGIVELAVEYHVPYIADVALSVERRTASGSRAAVPVWP